MKINFPRKGVLLVATLFLAPVMLPAAPAAALPGGHTTGSSGDVYAANNASNLLEQIRTDAYKVQNHAGQLQAFMRAAILYDRTADGSMLDRVRARVNEMDKLLFQLRTNAAEVSPWQQEAIARIAPTAVNLTDTTQDAIQSFNRNADHIFTSHLAQLANDMHTDANRINQAIGDFEQYAKAHREVLQLKQSLGLKSNS